MYILWPRIQAGGYGCCDYTVLAHISCVMSKYHFEKENTCMDCKTTIAVEWYYAWGLKVHPYGMWLYYSIVCIILCQFTFILELVYATIHTSNLGEQWINISVSLTTNMWNPNYVG